MDAAEAVESPFYHFTERDHNQPNVNTKHRLRVYRKFMGSLWLHGKSLDVGRENFISSELMASDQTTGDLNYWLTAPHAEYDAVTCFEVLNHVMNPLRLMDDIYALLKEGGKCYVSVPKLHLISWHHCRYDFATYASDRFEAMFRYAGFNVLKSQTHLPFPWWFMFRGVRPFLRVMFHRIQVFELERPRILTGADA